MKMVAGFIIGIAVCLLLVMAAGYYTSIVKAQDIPGDVEDPLGVSGLMPDVGKIYREALGSPYRQVASEITDPEIADFYRTLMDRTGLDKIGLE